MPTKLSRFCLGVMEAAWLAAVSVVPVFFDIYSTRIFEPDKITLLRSLALLTLAAWAVKLIDEGGNKWKEDAGETSLIKYLWKYPLIAPVIGLVLVYIISTIFSVTPSISFFGSYQRLQGTYTTFSYLIIFLSIITNLRSTNQIKRLVTTVIIASLPVSLYGLLQRYQIDPIPWGGNVSIRIASNMGNSIFVAAYLIMAFPLTAGRIIESFKEILSEGDQPGITRIKTTKQIIKATIYVFIGFLELIAIYMSGSRGPLLGLVAAIYFMFLLLSVYWRSKVFTLVIIFLAVLAAGFLAVFNIKNGPLQALRASPYIGRFGLLLDPESNSALVRQYIWEGTVKLVGFHAPLKFPDGSSDPFNFLRPVIGYGPESMYVAYNQFYQPELGQVEKRNASPDRSHNETWDSIVITGFAGLLVYLAIFGSVFYYGLKWQGFIKTRRNLSFFFACLVGGGVLGSVVLIILKGVEYLGVGLPFGMILGVVAYLTFYALFSNPQDQQQLTRNPYALLMIFLFSAIIGHFVEINFGIAIVATRTLFWTYTGVLLVVGFVLPKVNPTDTQASQVEVEGETKGLNRSNKREKYYQSRHTRRSERNSESFLGTQPAWFRNALIGAAIMGILLATLGFDFVTNSGHSKTFGEILINSLTRLPNKDNAISFGVLALILVTWLTGAFLFSTEEDENLDTTSWLKSLGLIALGSLAVGLIFYLLHAISLAVLAAFTAQTREDVIVQVNDIGSLLTKYYIYLFIILLLAAYLLPEGKARRSKPSTAFGVIAAPLALLSILILTNLSNLRVIHADVTFKMAEPFTKAGQWQAASFLYKRALELAPREDHYYLFLGRSYLEQAKQLESTSDQDGLVIQAEKDLKTAQSINPLNTDHTANLARLYSWWAGKATTNNARADRAQQASDYYGTAVTLSPNNSTLWDEWAVLLMQVIGQPQEALVRLQHALSLDASYSFTQGLLGDYYLRQANSSTDISTKRQALEQAAQYYRKAADVYKRLDTTSKASYLVSLGNVYIIMATLDQQNVNRQQLQQAIDILLEAVDSGVSSSDLWKIQEAIAKVYVQLGDKSQAQYYASLALSTAPDSATSRIQQIISQTLALP